MRCYLALLLEEDIRKYLRRIQEELVETGNGIRWVRPGNLHMTLQFLGEWEPRELDQLGDLLAELPERKPLELELGELGLLGSPSWPRVIHVGLDGQVDRLRELVGEIGECVEVTLGLPPEKRAWFPHITLGRIQKRGRDLSEKLQDSFLESRHESGRSLLPVTSFSLMQSQLKPAGAIYRQLREFSFAP